MTASFSVDKDNVTVSFSYTADATKVVDTVKSCVKNIYEQYANSGVGNVLFDDKGVLIPFEQLTNNQLLTILDQYILSMIIKKAAVQHEEDVLRAAMTTAMQSAKDDIASKFLT